ncbi:MAG: VOC family protein [Pedobacter sp.]|nr:VOC family protein [Pedobacter sp.]MDQ8053394.1 VOC family protein [Pedobacter sp.]
MNQIIHVRVGHLKDAANFFEDRLGMPVEDVMLKENEMCLRIKADDATEILLSEQHNRRQTSQIVILTSDCLENYCRLKARGVCFKKGPAYFDRGLCAVFSDPFGNDYTLLEERTYSEI